MPVPEKCKFCGWPLEAGKDFMRIEDRQVFVDSPSTHVCRFCAARGVKTLHSVVNVAV